VKTQNAYSPEVRERAARTVEEHRHDYPSLWATIESLAPKFGCVPQTLYKWMKRAQIEAGERPRTATEEPERLKALEREEKELRRANDILRTASAFFAQAELDRKLKS
jgi:transposase-like protein